MRWFLAAMLMLTLLTLVVSNHNVTATGGVETAFSIQSAGCCDALMDHALRNSAGIYLVADDNDNGDETGEKKEKDLEADPAGGVDRIWNTVQFA